MSSRKGGARSVQKWDPEEDSHLSSVLAALRESNGWEAISDVDWRTVSARVPDRSTKQCRERYFNVLDPTIKRSPWLASELDILFRSHSELGNSWQEIAKRIDGRSESQVKNVYYSAVRRAARESERMGAEVKPDFIVTQTAEREVKAGACSLSSFNPRPLAGAQANNGAQASAMMQQRARGGSMDASPTLAGIPGAATTQLQTHVSPAVGPMGGPMSGPVLETLTLPPPATSITPAVLEEEDDDGDVSLGSTPTVMRGSPMRPPHTHAPATMHMAGGLPQAAHALLPAVVANGVAQQQVHLFRRRNLLEASPLGAPVAPSEVQGGAVGHMPALSISAPALPLGPGPALLDLDEDVDLAAVNATVDSWLAPHQTYPSPRGETPPPALSINVASIRNTMAKRGGAMMGGSGTHSPSVLLSMSHMLGVPPANTSAFLSIPTHTSVRVG